MHAIPSLVPRPSACLRITSARAAQAEGLDYLTTSFLKNHYFSKNCFEYLREYEGEPSITSCSLRFSQQNDVPKFLLRSYEISY
jgi:hypothetical protein